MFLVIFYMRYGFLILMCVFLGYLLRREVYLWNKKSKRLKCCWFVKIIYVVESYIKDVLNVN